jgi:hypothetical protein
VRLAALAPVVLAAALAAGCGGRATATSACGAQGAQLLRDADRILVYNRATAPSPADLALFGFGDDLVAFRRGGCRPGLLGGVVTGGLGDRAVAELLSHLTAPMSRYLRVALACDSRRERSAACGGEAGPVPAATPASSNQLTP